MKIVLLSLVLGIILVFLHFAYVEYDAYGPNIENPLLSTDVPNGKLPVVLYNVPHKYKVYLLTDTIFSNLVFCFGMMFVVLSFVRFLVLWKIKQS